MPDYHTYSAPGSTTPVSYTWTGLNYQNQFSSLINITEPVYVNSISCYWAGDGGTASGYHAIWKVAYPGDLIVKSGLISVGSGSRSAGGQAWHTASIPETFLDTGHYFVGVWCDPSQRRVFSQWSYGIVNSYLYLKTMTSGIGPMGDSTSDTSGVLAAYVTGNPAGRVWINQGGTWRHSQVWINRGGTWTKTKGVWLNSAGTWKRSR